MWTFITDNFFFSSYSILLVGFFVICSFGFFNNYLLEATPEAITFFFFLLFWPMIQCSLLLVIDPLFLPSIPAWNRKNLFLQCWLVIPLQDTGERIINVAQLKMPAALTSQADGWDNERFFQQYMEDSECFTSAVFQIAISLHMKRKR